MNKIIPLNMKHKQLCSCSKCKLIDEHNTIYLDSDFPEVETNEN